MCWLMCSRQHFDYHSSHAKQRLLQMLVAVIHVGAPTSGCSELLVMELIQGVDYQKFAYFLNARCSTTIVLK